MASPAAEPVRNLVVVLGDQLDAGAAAFDRFDRERDAVLMMELAEEASYVPQHKQRLVLFFSAMRHFRAALRKRRRRVHYVTLDDADNRGSFREEVVRWVERTRAARLIVTEPGEHRVREALRAAAGQCGVPLDIRTDRHFYTDTAQFEDYARGRRELLLENFYRAMRRRHDVLMKGGKPLGGRWNFDAENRSAFGKAGPGEVRAPRRFRPDRTTRDVMAMVEREFADSPGSTRGFGLPVTRAHAQSLLADFVEHRLPRFGDHQDAMAAGEPFLYHSLLSTSLNLHLLDPRAAVQAAVEAGEAGAAPPNAVEGFVRQVLGWREYVRGVYWSKMPDYAALNALDAQLPMPAFMWSGETDMRCVSESVGQLVAHAYTHHIQRLMVLGLLAMLLGVNPYEVHRWHLSLYADAIDWVSLPNVLGMSQYGDGGIVGTKPYCASGNYINRMSDYCAGCRFDPGKSTGDDACPFTTLYWDFLRRHRKRFAGNPRMGFQIRNLERKSRTELASIRKAADELRDSLTAETYL